MLSLFDSLFSHLATLYIDKLWIWYVFLSNPKYNFFFFSLQRVNGHIGLCKAKTGDSKNSSVEIFSWMRPMGFSLMTSLPSSVRWVLLPRCESSNSQPWWVSVDVIVLYEGWWVRKIPKWSGAAQMRSVWLTEKLCRDFKVVGHPSSPPVTFLKAKVVYYLGMCDFLAACIRILAFSLWIFSESIWKDC